MNAKFAVCRHIKTNGRRCQSPALTGGALCYFHRNLHRSHRRPQSAEALTSNWQESAIASESGGHEDPFVIARAYPLQNEIQFPPLEDAESVQLATSVLFQAIATGQIHFARARLLIYTLKIASINQRALAVARAADHAAHQDSTAIPNHVVRTTHGRALAAPDHAAPSQAVASPNAADTHPSTPLEPARAAPAPKTHPTPATVPAPKTHPTPTAVLAPKTHPTPATILAPKTHPTPATILAPKTHPTPTAAPAPRARHIPAWAEGPGNSVPSNQRAESPTHRPNLEATQPLTLIQ